MTVKFSVAVRNARADAKETAIGSSAIMKIFSGAPPANITDADSGTVIATLNLPADWLADASNGVKSKSGTWQDLSADNAGTMGHYRIYDNGETTAHEQGTVTNTGGGGDMEVDNTNAAQGQQFTVTTYGQTEGNA